MQAMLAKLPGRIVDSDVALQDLRTGLGGGLTVCTGGGISRCPRRHGLIGGRGIVDSVHNMLCLKIRGAHVLVAHDTDCYKCHGSHVGETILRGYYFLSRLVWTSRIR
jgi:hypothetical protein